MEEHHGHIEAAVPHFGGAMMTVFQMKILFQALVAAFGRCAGLVFVFPLLRITWRDVDQSGVIFPDKMDRPSKFGIRARLGARAEAGGAVHKRAAVLGPVFGVFNAVMAHLETGAADRNAVRADGEIVFIFELGSTFVVEVNERRDALPLLSSPKLLKFKTLLKLITLKTERDGDEHQTYQVQKSS